MTPHEILEKFKVLFTDSFITTPEKHKERYRFLLTEADENAKLREVEVRNVPQNSILVKMHAYPPPEKIFQSTRGERKRCDYIILTSYKDDLYFIFIEMKSRELDNKDVIPQLVGGNCFMIYCSNMVAMFHDASISADLLRKRNIVFYASLPLNKKATSLEKLLKRIRPTRPLPDPIIYIPRSIRDGKAFIDFDAIAFDMPNESLERGVT